MLAFPRLPWRWLQKVLFTNKDTLYWWLLDQQKKKTRAPSPPISQPDFARAEPPSLNIIASEPVIENLPASAESRESIGEILLPSEKRESTSSSVSSSRSSMEEAFDTGNIVMDRRGRGTKSKKQKSGKGITVNCYARVANMMYSLDFHVNGRGFSGRIQWYSTRISQAQFPTRGMLFLFRTRLLTCFIAIKHCGIKDQWAYDRQAILYGGGRRSERRVFGMLYGSWFARRYEIRYYFRNLSLHISSYFWIGVKAKGLVLLLLHLKRIALDKQYGGSTRFTILEKSGL